MRGVERLTHLSRDVTRLGKRHGALSDPISERRSLDQFQHECLDVVRFFKAVNRRDVRMVERGQQLRFTLEASQPVWIEREGVRQDFQRDVAAQRGVVGAIDFAHPARTDEHGDLVDADASAESEGHRNYRGLYERCGSDEGLRDSRTNSQF